MLGKKRPKLNGHIPTMCNKLIEFVMNFDVKLLSNAIAVLLLAFSDSDMDTCAPVAGFRGQKSALWKPVLHIANRLFNINAVQLTMLCKQVAVFHSLSRLSRRLCRPGTCPPQPHIFACPSRPAPRASARAVCLRCPHRTILHRPALHRAARVPHHPAPRAKTPGAFAPGAGCYGAVVPAHAPMSWQ